jgi:hypothetical protein
LLQALQNSTCLTPRKDIQPEKQALTSLPFITFAAKHNQNARRRNNKHKAEVSTIRFIPYVKLAYLKLVSKRANTYLKTS